MRGTRLPTVETINPVKFLRIPEGVAHVRIIEKLIGCESQGVNISRPDSDGIFSDGILQFHRDGTWEDMVQRGGPPGSPIIPDQALRMADWMIAHGFLHRWSCARILGFLDRSSP